MEKMVPDKVQSSSSSSSKSKSKRRKCYLCGNRGHEAGDCKTPRPTVPSKPDSSSGSEPSQTEETVNGKNSSSNPKWVPKKASSDGSASEPSEGCTQT